MNERWQCVRASRYKARARLLGRIQLIKAASGPAAADYSCDALSRVHAITRCEIDRWGYVLVVNLPSVKRYKRHVVEGEPRYARWPRRLVCTCAVRTHTQERGGHLGQASVSRSVSRTRLPRRGLLPWYRALICEWINQMEPYTRHLCPPDTPLLELNPTRSRRSIP